MHRIKWMICLLILFAFADTTLPAQNTSIGLKLGGLQSFSPANTGSNAIGFRLGGFLTYSIASDYGVSGELNFVRKGYRTNGEQRVSLDYLEIPLMGYYFFGKGGFRPKLMVGPYFAYALSAKQGGQTLNNAAETDYGIVLGAGFHKSVGGGRWLNVDLRYSHGLEQALPSPEYANRDLALNVGLSFPLNLPD